MIIILTMIAEKRCSPVSMNDIAYGFINEKALEADPECAIADYAKALFYYEMILEIDSEDAWAYLYKARCQAQLDLPAEACESLRKLAKACESLSVALELNDECLYDLNYYDEFASLKDYPAYKELFE